MTDIQQWRRMIQPTRARTPAIDFEDGELSTVPVINPSSSPTTSRRGLKPKISSYFTQHTTSAVPGKTDLAFGDDLFSPIYPSWPADDPLPSLDAESLIDSIMCRLLADPYGRLDPRFNSMLLHIFESFRDMIDRKNRLVDNLNDANDRCHAIERTMYRSAEQWNRERQDYKDEVKRLELILANGKRGLAEVTLARQDSVLRHRNWRSSPDLDSSLETIFEFLEKSKRYEDKTWSSQRGTLCPRTL